MTRKGQLGRSHEVSEDGQTWSPATSFPELFDRPEASTPVVANQFSGAGVQALDELEVAPSELAWEVSPVAAGRPIMWHYTRNGIQHSTPIEQSQLVSMVMSSQLGSQDLVWCEGMSSWKPVSQVPDLSPPAAAWGYGTGSGSSGGAEMLGVGAAVTEEYRRFVSKKTSAGICALLLGNFGIHKFMLGLTTGGLTMLILFFLIIPIPFLAIVSLAEGIIYLTKSDEKFFRDYAVNRKQWF